ncbi:lasso RiPP family leader peptide-containing protein [Bifidobacterium longum]|uniref:lasso RiPP family leader peptide-containing protein n=1 Tax=Bifidobacterium longum TaxID=216816 RepID=UPI002073AF5C|nr:lasso RiPP family leader peptide-containing protein [Bifidobacterium longum]
MYTKPTVTTIGSFKEVTNGAGKAHEKDLLGFRALIVLYWPWARCSDAGAEQNIYFLLCTGSSHFTAFSVRILPSSLYG